MNLQPTPLDRLRNERLQLYQRIRKQERKIEQDVTFIRQHASTFFISGISGLFFSRDNLICANAGKMSSRSSLLLSIFSLLRPLLQEMLLPMLIRRLMRKLKRLFLGK